MEAPSVRLLFDFPDIDGSPPSRREYRDPVEIVVAETIGEVVPALRRVEEEVKRGFHAAGYLTYEAAPAFEPRMAVHPEPRMPLAWFGIFSSYESIEGGKEHRAAAGSLDRGPWVPDVDKDRYAGAVDTIRSVIEEGRSYQVNLTARLTRALTEVDQDAEAYYSRLRRAQGDGYHALLETGPFTIVSVSPELFFHRRDDIVTTRPMKGTRPRGRWSGEDEELTRQLLTSEKELAENRMIVDLLRNDLGRLAAYGSVEVSNLLSVERYRTVLQMTSTVQAEISRDVPLEQLLAALFPCGSVTGAPKISTMEVIAQLEATPREVYCGAIGFLDGKSGACTFSVPIRTLWMDHARGTAHYGSGGGITWDSNAEEEYRELLTKARVVEREWPDFDLLETLRLHDGRIAREARHLDRLLTSARYFGLTVEREEVEKALGRLRRSHPAGSWRVRLTVDHDGSIGTEMSPWSGPSTGKAEKVVIDSHPVDESDPFLFHKTTHRAVYLSARARHPDVFDVILYNQRGMVTEFTRGNLVAQIDDQLVTPPIEDGLLGGCLRAQAIDEGVISERSIPLQELERARALFFVNSLRGWVPVRLLDDLDHLNFEDEH